MNKRKKYLLIYLRTGGGHLAPANSIAKIFESKYGDSVEPVMLDGFEKSNSLMRNLIEGGYRGLQAKATWFYETLYFIHKSKIIASLSGGIVGHFIKPSIKKAVVDDKPDKIIIFHFFLIKPVYQIVKAYNINVPVITVVTDPYTAHPLWFLNKKQNFVVFSERLKQSCISKGISSENLHLFPFILNEKFSAPLQEERLPALKDKLGFPADKKIVLVMGGGDGIPKGIKIIKLLLDKLRDIQVTLVCGKNKELFHNAEALKREGDYENLKVYAYVDFVYELINIADVVITKCGASTFMEILMTKKIPVITNYLWEQEMGNMEFLRDNRMGIYEHKIRRLPILIGNLLADKDLYSQYIANIERASLENGAEKVAAFIAGFSEAQS